jgi:hypothetical protein
MVTKNIRFHLSKEYYHLHSPWMLYRRILNYKHITPLKKVDTIPWERVNLKMRIGFNLEIRSEIKSCAIVYTQSNECKR